MHFAGRFSGRGAVITWGASGLGREVARRIVREGGKVALWDVDAEHLAEAGEDVGATLTVELDVTDHKAVAAAAKKSNAALGGRIDILVASAGVTGATGPVHEYPVDSWVRTVDINLNGVFRCCRAFGKSMLAHGGGSIVNVGSMSGLIVNRPQEQVNYNASKAGVHHLTRSLAAEWGARGVRVNAVAPTYIDTDMNRYVHEDAQMYRHWVGGTPMNRLGRVDEVASVVLFLASEASSLMTGSIVLADGGYVCW